MSDLNSLRSYIRDLVDSEINKRLFNLMDPLKVTVLKLVGKVNEYNLL